MHNNFVVILVVAACIAVEATPLAKRQSDLQCLTDDPVILALQSLSATSFCSSLLDISTTTITTTIASDALTTTTVTTTATGTTSVPVQVSTVTSTQTLTSCSLNPLRKRGKCTKGRGHATTPTGKPGYSTKTDNSGYKTTEAPTYSEHGYPHYETKSSKKPESESQYPHYPEHYSSQNPEYESQYPDYPEHYSSKEPEYKTQYPEYPEHYSSQQPEYKTQYPGYPEDYSSQEPEYETQHASPADVYPTAAYPYSHPQPTYGVSTYQNSDTSTDTYPTSHVWPTYGASSYKSSDTLTDTYTAPYTWPPLYDSSSGIISDTFTSTSPTSTSSTTSTSTTKTTITNIPTELSVFDAADLSFGCSCLSLPTSSVVVTVTDAGALTATDVVTVSTTTTISQSVSIVTTTTTTTESACATPAVCGNAGIQWAEYRNFVERANDDATYSNFVPEVYKGQAPEIPGTYGNIGPIEITSTRSRLITIYNTPRAFPSAFFALDHKGYFFAPVSGRYIFSVTNVDDAVFLWLGATAYSGWTRTNADGFGVSNQGNGFTRAFADLTAGQYLPVRLMLAQSEGPASFSFFITAPDGTNLVSPDIANSPYLVQFSCDGVTAPAFANWTLET
ncbi:hypothetical protein PFICI_12318 [Pestalotiopsis fici W106-1]|uniref:PA14 domain-containing protein n=1 Tax=Pestalotiopsis fici (strain W106-1 / CGMCC3.15140) TaxID=1229662 RepID=W3WNL0_PESFW|nr:uncharacterized protein PFICI_12318 [Pestalotiopsis fici W106-1]ETS75374.1 hypothetical protein PFICI_12318 [Pestalotiopsis fici W106-1]